VSIVSILWSCTGDRPATTAASASPTPALTATPIAVNTPCEPDPSAAVPCPGTPEPVVHQPLPPPGPIPDADIRRHLPPSLSKGDRDLLQKVMQARSDYERPNVRWIYCDTHIVIFMGGGYGKFTAAQVLNDNPRPKNNGGAYINIHNCIIFPMPGG
jgi:hypothetical protein